MTDVEAAVKTKSRVGLIGLLAVFFVPLILALLMFFNLDAWRHPERSNYGELMLPIEPLTSFTGVGADGSVLDITFFEKIWSVVYVAQGQCDIYCETSLFVITHARLRLGRDSSRLQYVYLATDQASYDSGKSMQERNPAMQIVRVVESDVASTLQLIDTAAPTNTYLIDPHANKVLRYPSGSSTKGLYSDLHKLLENSRIG